MGDFDFGSGASVHLRDFGVYNQSLYDDLLSDFQPLRDTDVLVVNWGAWYPRFSWNQKEVRAESHSSAAPAHFVKSTVIS